MPTIGTPGSAQATGTASVTATGITTSGSNKALFAGVGSSSGAPQLTSSVTYNGTAMVEMWDGVAQSFYHNSGHYLVAPAASGNLVATLAASDDELAVHGIPLSDVDQATPIGTVPSMTNGNSATASVTVSSATGDLVLAHLYGAWLGGTAGAGETEHTEQIIVASASGATYSEAGAASVTIAPTRTAVGPFSDAWLINGVSFKAAGGGGGAPAFPDWVRPSLRPRIFAPGPSQRG